jgi:hypothetical protein
LIVSRRDKKKTKKIIKLKKLEKNYWKNQTVEKPIKSIRISKKPTSSVLVLQTWNWKNQIESNPNRKKNWAKLKKSSQIEKT